MEQWISELLLRWDSAEKINVWNLDETTCFWQALPELIFRKKGRNFKKAKQRFTIIFVLVAIILPAEKNLRL